MPSTDKTNSSSTNFCVNKVLRVQLDVVET